MSMYISPIALFSNFHLLGLSQLNFGLFFPLTKRFVSDIRVSVSRFLDSGPSLSPLSYLSDFHFPLQLFVKLPNWEYSLFSAFLNS